MSMMRCERHEVTYDTDFNDDCPMCASEPIENNDSGIWRYAVLHAGHVGPNWNKYIDAKFHTTLAGFERAWVRNELGD